MICVYENQRTKRDESRNVEGALKAKYRDEILRDHAKAWHRGKKSFEQDTRCVWTPSRPYDERERTQKT